MNQPHSSHCHLVNEREREISLSLIFNPRTKTPNLYIIHHINNCDWSGATKLNNHANKKLKYLKKIQQRSNWLYKYIYTDYSDSNDGEFGCDTGFESLPEVNENLASVCEHSLNIDWQTKHNNFKIN